jgi:TatD DNase family protein
MLIDVHCHLDLCKKPTQEIVNKDMLIISNGTDLASNKKVLNYAKRFPNVKVALGLYPSDAIELSNQKIIETLKFIEENKDKIVAIGEVGIDFYHIKTEKEQEKEIEVFKKIITLANKIRKPLIIHSRKATEKALELLKEAKVPVIMHCFEGNAEQTEEALQQGYYFTIPANFWTRKGFKNTAKRVPINKILTETDSPYLSPTDEENKPENVKYTIKELAKLKNMTSKQVEKQIYQNATKVFINL